MFCVPSGTTVGEVIELAGGIRDGAALGAVQPGGASTNFLGPDCLDLPLTFDAVAEAGSALGTGAMVVMAEGTDLLAAATTVLEVLPQRVVRQVRAVPRRLEQGGADPHRDPRARRERGGRRRAHRRARGDAAAHVDLRARPGRARPRACPCCGCSATTRRRRPPRAGATGRRAARRPPMFLEVMTVAEALGALAPARRSRGRAGARRRRASCPPRTCARASSCPRGRARPSTATRCAPPTRTRRARRCPRSSSWPARWPWATSPTGRSGRARRWRSPPAGSCRTAPTRS